MTSRESVGDTKKAYLDSFFENHAESKRAKVEHLKTSVENVLDYMADTFTDDDTLLRSVGMISLYFLLFEAAVADDQTGMISRHQFEEFESKRNDNRQIAEQNIAEANYNLLEFDRFAQSPNDGIAMRFRLAVLDRHLYKGALGFAQDGVLSDEDELEDWME